jgi:hypothetical protein
VKVHVEFLSKMACTVWTIIVRLPQTFWEFTRDREGRPNNLSRPHPQKIHVQKRPTRGPTLPSSSKVISAHAVSRADQTNSHYVLHVTSTFKSSTHTLRLFSSSSSPDPTELLLPHHQHDHLPTHHFHLQNMPSQMRPSARILQHTFASHYGKSHLSIIPHEDPL